MADAIGAMSAAGAGQDAAGGASAAEDAKINQMMEQGLGQVFSMIMQQMQQNMAEDD